ncbi:MAG: phosphatase PAP2 family protein [Bacteroidetes bacterium]|nr:phosphatase PAP2 family protein [Bacteroidota bacterium]
MNRFFIHHNTTDLVNSIFFALLTVAMTAWSHAIPPWWIFASSNILIIILIRVLASYSARRGHLWNLVHGFYMLLLIPVAFKQMYYLVPAIHPVDYDAALIVIDRMLFGGDPTRWMHGCTHPVLTELLQLAYASYYFLPFILAVDLYKKRRVKAFKTVFLFVILGFYISYLGYVAVPAIGPRFTLHEFENTEEELPGVLAATALRVYTNTGESIPPGTPYPAAQVQRDAFPSGHTKITLLVIFLAFRYRSRTRWFIGVVGSLLIIATVYLRYHYVIDLFAGALFAWLTVELALLLDHWWAQRRQRFSSSLQSGHNSILPSRQD